MTTPEILPQQERENPEPVEGANPAPWFVILLVAALFIFGVVYISRTNLNTPSTWGDGRAAAELEGSPAPAPGQKSTAPPCLRRIASPVTKRQDWAFPVSFRRWPAPSG